METENLLESMLAEGKQIAERGLDAAQDKLGVPEEPGAERDAMLDGMQKGVLTAGALALLLGTGAGRRLTGTALKLGSVAAIGGLAFKAYNDWQAKIEDGSGSVRRVESASPQSPQVDQKTQQKNIALIRAMVAAAKADGHVDDAEKKAMLAHVDEQQFDADTLEFLKTQITTDVSVAEIAALADTPVVAGEIYLACTMVIDKENPIEKEWLDSLSAELKLSDELITTLEKQLA